MATTTLKRAFDSLRTLPADMQEEIASKLLDYSTRWRELKAGIAQGSDELARGEGVEIDDIGEFVGRITEPHGRS